ncbi:hypothetical protein NC651_005465 [Populus alba x Populus x berolinensis]|nr:hypothetical protein NC651_005465 [Populus alba x Populus x berolinensis]
MKQKKLTAACNGDDKLGRCKCRLSREKWTSEERVFLCSYSSPSSSPLEVVCGHMGPPPWFYQQMHMLSCSNDST